jgi:hypothetical protein
VGMCAGDTVDGVERSCAREEWRASFSPGLLMFLLASTTRKTQESPLVSNVLGLTPQCFSAQKGTPPWTVWTRRKEGTRVKKIKIIINKSGSLLLVLSVYWLQQEFQRWIRQFFKFETTHLSIFLLPSWWPHLTLTLQGPHWPPHQTQVLHLTLKGGHDSPLLTANHVRYLLSMCGDWNCLSSTHCDLGVPEQGCPHHFLTVLPPPGACMKSPSRGVGVSSS